MASLAGSPGFQLQPHQEAEHAPTYTYTWAGWDSPHGKIENSSKACTVFVHSWLCTITC